MSNANRDYAIVYDVKNSSLVLSRPLIFYITDRNTSNIFVRLVTKVNIGNGVDQYTDIEEASSYVLTMRVIKPNNEVNSIEATQHEEASIFQFDLTEDFKDIPGKYICELTISTIVSERQELITSDPFNYEVKRSILSNISEIIETEDTTVENLLNNLEASKSRLFNDLELAKTNLHNDLNATSSALNSQVQASNNKIENIKEEVSSRLDATEAELSSRIKENETNKLTFNKSNIDDLYYLINSNITGDSGSYFGNLRVSSDGKHFSFVKQIPTWTACSSLIHRNGIFYKLDVCHNGDEYTYDFILSTSKNLIDWNVKNVSMGFKNTQYKSYGGDFFEDDNGDIYIILSIQDGTDSEQANNDHFSLFLVRMNILGEGSCSFTNYRRLKLDTVNRIDGNIFKHGVTYYLVSKREVEGEIEIFRSTNLVDWEFINTIDVYSKTKTGYLFEAPSMQYHNGEFIIYADDFGGTYVTGSYNGGMVYTTTTDFRTFTKPKYITNSDHGFRHAQVKKANTAQEYNMISNLYANNVLTQDIDNYASKFVNIVDRLSGTTLKLLSQSNYIYRMYSDATIEKIENVSASYFDIVMIGSSTLTLKSSERLQLPNGVSELVLNPDVGEGTKIIRFTRVDNCYYMNSPNPYTIKANIIKEVPLRKSYKLESGASTNITFKVKNANGLIDIKGHSNYVSSKDRIINACIGCLNGASQLYNLSSDTQQITMSSSFSNSTYTFTINLTYEWSRIDVTLPVGAEIIW